MSVHLEVLTQTAAKLCAVVQAGKGPGAAGMAEYVYPAQRARQFLHQFRGQGERPSYRKFAAVVERYEDFVRRMDASRARGDWPEEARLAAECAALRQLAAEVRADLEAGR